jgi:phosphomethylpyrimidine synthase
MADAPARTELTAEGSQRPEGVLNVTTGPIRGSRKVRVGPLGVAMREIDLEPSSG